MKQFMKSKKGIILSAVLVLVVIAGVIWYQNTAWERDLTVKYVDVVFKEGSYSTDYYLYEITNNTARTLRNVYAEIEVFNAGNWKWTFDSLISTNLKVGETATYKLYWSAVQKSAEDRGSELIFASVDIKRIKYK